MVLEPGKSKIKALTDLVSGEGQLPDSKKAILSVCSQGGRGEGTLWGPFYKDSNLIPEGVHPHGLTPWVVSNMTLRSDRLLFCL